MDARAAALIAPTLVPTRIEGRSPRASSSGSSTASTPTSYAPRAPPPERTSAVRPLALIGRDSSGWSGGPRVCWPPGELRDPRRDRRWPVSGGRCWASPNAASCRWWSARSSPASSSGPAVLGVVDPHERDGLVPLGSGLRDADADGRHAPAAARPPAGAALRGRRRARRHGGGAGGTRRSARGRGRGWRARGDLRGRAGLRLGGGAAARDPGERSRWAGGADGDGPGHDRRRPHDRLGSDRAAALAHLARAAGDADRRRGGGRAALRGAPVARARLGAARPTPLKASPLGARSEAVAGDPVRAAWLAQKGGTSILSPASGRG